MLNSVSVENNYNKKLKKLLGMLIMNFIQIAIAALFYLLLTGCSAPVVEPVKVELTNTEINYLRDVKPILDKRCVSCHSCYNSPCQSKFSSFEGVDRGGSKLLVYDATRLYAVDPTRLFIDAKNTQEWHEKNFYSVTKSADSNESYNDSIMMHMIYDKKKNPQIMGAYEPESDELMCPKNKQELNEYLDAKENHGMPYGFPALKETEYVTLAQWLHRGAKGPSALEQKNLVTPSKNAAQEIKKWEKFLNTEDAKHSLTARYLYEHLFLAHWNFKSAPGEFYEIVRSSTPSPQEIEIIPTLRPYDDPKVKKFYYRLNKIHSTIVHKTHMVVEFDDKKLQRIHELFIKPKWIEEPHYIDYDVKMSANPFVAFYQIPAKFRYQFLLDNANYIVMTYIRGPVCRGQMALNVIHDHFWVMFSDPEFDLSLSHPDFIKAHSDNLSMPIETSDKALLKTFSDEYKDKYEQYFYAKQELYNEIYPKGLGLEAIWRGNTQEDTPLLSIYRHFDSASVHKGVLGELPRTMWVIDYPQFERIYYSLVAGYDVFGNLSHQTNIRRYMDFLRMEGELNFISFMPYGSRLELFKSWYINDKEIQSIQDEEGAKGYGLLTRGTKVEYKTKNYKSEFIEQVVEEHILKSTNIHFDDINYYKEGHAPVQMPKVFKTHKDILNAARSLSEPGTGFIKHITDNGVNTLLVRVVKGDGSSKVFTVVVNRWHDNVNSLFNGEQIDPNKDTLDFIDASVGSYPNMFAKVHYRDLPDFFDLLQNFDGSDAYMFKMTQYFVGRDDEDFWENFDWFQNNFNKSDSLNAGLYDLNRYYRYGWEEFGY